MNTPTKLGVFGLGLAVVFTAALGLGRAIGPDATTVTTHDQHGEPAATAATILPAGLQVTQDGYRLQPISTALAVGAAEPFRFRVLGPDGAPVTGYTRDHDKDLHLIVVRRDLSGFQHVHPEMAADGTWSVPLAVAEPGQYRVFADFRPAAHDDGLTLGTDVPAPGDYQPRPLPAAERSTTVDGYTVTLAGDLVPGDSARLTLSVSKAGSPVTDLEPYLGAYGHLVALRAGDLAYLHVHPDDTTTAGPGIVFHADVPSAGDYRLYLDFQHGGTVHTAEFTATAGSPPVAPSSSPEVPSAQPSATGHDADGHTHD
ncbi:hypothetical protein [Actinoplanes derwentensis]|uniref:Heavy-metal-associated domain-containing protein n=1 Tax=Actinoplanes derwentensis TaxID=113562 RepID=A0A1H2DFD7_9ACTN|nr:hypothetical protein [Actinoplanes derwentensis]GID84851.1 hypothetical protein Ade03nite_37750 [Actinoplanes derwentensis]SDT80946.1 hypothetical protein SAMN04489716_9430 [Actinoplanes derwentensis]